MEDLTTDSIVSAFTSDIVVSSISEQQDLLLAQQDLSRALKSGEPLKSLTSDALSAVSIASSAFHDANFNLNLAGQRTEEPIHIVRRSNKDLPFDSGINTRLGHGRKPLRSHGVFRDHLKNQISFDVFDLETYKPVSLTIGDPVMYTNGTEVRTNSPFVTSLGPGSVRIRASALVRDTPPNSFIHLKILSGDVSRPPVPVPRRVNLKLAPLDETIPNPIGINLIAPDSAQFSFQSNNNRTTGILTGLGSGEFTVLGNRYHVQYSSVPPSYDSTRNQIMFPLINDISSFQPGDNSFQQVNFIGKTTISQTVWSLPVDVEQPPTFRPAAESYAYVLMLQAGLQARVEGQKHTTECGACVLFVVRGGLFIDGLAGAASKDPQILALGNSEGVGQGEAADRKSFITFRSSFPLKFTFLAIRDTQEIWRAQVIIAASLDQPRTINNHRVPFENIADLQLTRALETTTTQISITSSGIRGKPEQISFALKNALFTTKTGPLRFGLTGQYESGIVVAGNLELTFPLERAMPFLPDPYATNIKLQIEPLARAQGVVTITCSWSPLLSMTTNVNLGSSPFRILQTNEATGFDRDQQKYQQGYLSKQKTMFGFEDFQWISDVRKSPTPVLLDVSTNVAQFGVMIPTIVSDSTVVELMLQAPSSQVHMVTLPSVNWEPVEDGPWTLATFDQGPMTRIASPAPSKSLPISPKEMLGSFVKDFSPLSPVSTRVSLPFGMVALIDANVQPLILDHTTLSQVQPAFDLDPPEQQNRTVITGVDQISIQRRPAIPILFPPNSRPAERTDSPSFPGVTALVKTFTSFPNNPANPGLVDVLTGNDPVSTAVSTTFVREMQDKVPLTRIDITGYGESTFSDWRFLPSVTPQNPSGTGISKVAFQVLNGRASRESVRLNSIMAPCAAKLIRQVDIIRLNNGKVVRIARGWKATSDGRYRYDQTNIFSYPGLVLRVTNITNIRDVTNELVRYDCILVIDNPNSPNGELEVPARDQIGYVFVGTATGPPVIDPASVSKVLTDNKLGGELDFILEIGKSTQKMRVTSVTASPARGMGVMALWGSLLFEGDGQWSMTRQVMGVDEAPQPVDGVRGVPLIRDGRHDEDLSRRTGPYLFKEPSELFDNPPKTVYGIVHGAPSYRVLFQQPEVSASPPVTTLDIVSGLPALITQGVKVADKYALAKSQGIFPDLKSCLPVGDESAKQALQILKGQYKFEPDMIPLGATAARVLNSDKTFSSLVSTVGSTLPGGEIVNPATMNLVIDTAKKISNLNIENLALETLNGEGKVVSKVVSSLKDEASKIGDMLDVKHFYGEALEQVRKVVSFLEKLNILPNFKVTMTNAWGMQLSSSMTRKELLDKLPEVSRPAVEKIIEQFDLSLKLIVTLAEFQFNMHIKVTVKVPSGFGPTALGVGGFDIALGTSGTSLSLELGCGIGVEFQVGPFKASASYAQSQTIMVRPDGFGVGVTATLRAHVDLVVASASLFLEAKLLLVGGKCDKTIEHERDHHGDTIWAYAQVRICLEVSIFLIIHVKVDEEAHWENKLNSGKCLLDDMIDLQ